MTDSFLSRHPELAWRTADGPDPFIELEALDDARVDTWVNAQNARTTHAFGKTEETDALTKRLATAYTSQERIVSCSRYDDWGYNTWQDELNPLGIVRRTPWAAWLAGKPEWQIVLDVDALDLNQATGKEDAIRWALHDFDMLYPTWDRALVSLSPGGSDACMVREFDIESRTFVEDGFQIPDVGKHGISWIDRDTVYLGWDDSAHSKKPALTTSGFPRQARKWKRGTPLADAPVVFEGKRRDVSAGVDYDPIEKLHLASRATTFFETLQYWLDEATGAWQQYDVPLHAELEHWNGWLFVTPREPYEVGAATYPGGSLLVIRRDAFLEGAREFTVLFTPSGRNVLADIDFTKHWLAVSQMDDGSPRVELRTPPDNLQGDWARRDFALPAASQSYVDPIDSERDDTVLVHVEHFLTPPSLYFADLAEPGKNWQLLARLPAQFDAAGLVAERRHASAPDGVEIPYWLIGREANVKGEKAAPSLLYGYGGFEVALDPHYDATTGMAWLESGGLLAIANIRGGGEFGPDWHRAAQREKRQVAFDDFIAVAEALIASGVTTPKQLAIRGGSNGGLLTGVVMIQRPELFGAVLSEVPLLDMARFHLLLQGASWIDEYGDPDDPRDLHFLMSYSPYQNVRAEAPYPSALFSSSATDDRVHPGHARKMAAKMQAQGHPDVWYLENRDGGHGAGVEAEAIARVEATVFTFLKRTIGSV
jgi:prolyl oligopeptidase